MYGFLCDSAGSVSCGSTQPLVITVGLWAKSPGVLPLGQGCLEAGAGRVVPITDPFCHLHLLLLLPCQMAQGLYMRPLNLCVSPWSKLLTSCGGSESLGVESWEPKRPPVWGAEIHLIVFGVASCKPCGLWELHPRGGGGSRSRPRSTRRVTSGQWEYNEPKESAVR